jgi:hypothetical protein
MSVESLHSSFPRKLARSIISPSSPPLHHCHGPDIRWLTVHYLIQCLDDEVCLPISDVFIFCMIHPVAQCPENPFGTWGVSILLVISQSSKGGWSAQNHSGDPKFGTLEPILRRHTIWQERFSKNPARNFSFTLGMNLPTVLFTSRLSALRADRRLLL